MSKGFPERIFGLPAPATAVTGTAKTSLLVGQKGEKSTLFAKYFDIVGKAIQVDLEGQISNIITTPGTLTLTMELGAIAAVWTSGAIQLNAVAKTNVPWTLKGQLFVSALGDGTTATIEGTLEFKSESLVGSPLPSVGGSGSLLVPVAVAAGAGFDSTLAQIIDWSAQFSLTGNSLQLRKGSMDYWP